MNTTIPSSTMEMSTLEQRWKLNELQRAMSAVAAPVGPMHAWWDDIFEMREIVMKPEGLFLIGTMNRVMSDAELTLTRWGHKLPY